MGNESPSTHRTSCEFGSLAHWSSPRPPRLGSESRIRSRATDGAQPITAHKMGQLGARMLAGVGSGPFDNAQGRVWGVSECLFDTAVCLPYCFSPGRSAKRICNVPQPNRNKLHNGMHQSCNIEFRKNPTPGGRYRGFGGEACNKAFRGCGVMRRGAGRVKRNG